MSFDNDILEVTPCGAECAAEESNIFSVIGTKVATPAAVRRNRAYPDNWEVENGEFGPEKGQGAKRWAARHGTFWGATETYNFLPPGLYRCSAVEGIGPTLKQQDVQMDTIIPLPDPSFETILTEFDKFWLSEDIFRAKGYIMKRGFMFWGPAGSGKTTLINLLTQKLVQQHEGIVLFVDYPPYAMDCMRMVRQIEPKRKMICILEELEALVERNGEAEYLAMLDGEAQIDNVIFIGSTNYPERLDPRFVDRPSRFDTVRFIGMPKAAARRAYLMAKHPALVGDELDVWVAKTSGFSIAHLKELIIATTCFDQTFEDVIERLEQMHTRRPSSEDSPEKNNIIGFTRQKNFEDS